MHIAKVICVAVLIWSLPLRGADSPRNIVLMIGDDHGLELGCYGHPVVKTPSLDRLAAEGTRFTHAFAAVSSCSPSRSTIYTGTYVHANGMYGLAHADHNFHSYEKMQSLPSVLRAAGYRTAVIGKLHVQPESTYPFEQLPCPGGARNVIKMAEQVRSFLEKADKQPFLLVVGFVDPHRAKKGFGNDAAYPGVSEVKYDPAQMVIPPFLPDTPEVRSELAEYCQSVSRMDQGVGAMLAAIEETGHKTDTMVVYLSDNGIPFPGGKTTLYEPGIHLPLLVSTPTQSRRGGTCDAMVSWVDVAPTLLEWAGASAPKTMAGRSFLRILGDQSPPGWDRVFASHVCHEVTMYYPVRMLRTRQYKYIYNVTHSLEYPFASDLWESATWQAVLRRGDQQYGQRTVEALLHRPKEELYDLLSDPQETHNLAGDSAHSDVVNDLRRQLKEFQESTSDPWLVKYKHE